MPSMTVCMGRQWLGVGSDTPRHMVDAHCCSEESCACANDFCYSEQCLLMQGGIWGAVCGAGKSIGGAHGTPAPEGGDQARELPKACGGAHAYFGTINSSTPTGKNPTLCLVLGAPLQAAFLGALALKLLQPAFCHFGVKYEMSNFLAPQGYVPRPVLGALGLLGQPAHCQISVPSSEAGLLAVTLEDIQNVPISAEVLLLLNSCLCCHLLVLLGR